MAAFHVVETGFDDRLEGVIGVVFRRLLRLELLRGLDLLNLGIERRLRGGERLHRVENFSQLIFLEQMPPVPAVHVRSAPVVLAVDAVDVRADRFGNLRSLLEELTPGRGVGAGVGVLRVGAREGVVHVIVLLGDEAHVAHAQVPVHVHDGFTLRGVPPFAGTTLPAAVADPVAQPLEPKLLQDGFKFGRGIRRVDHHRRRDETRRGVLEVLLDVRALARVSIRAVFDGARHERVIFPLEHRWVELYEVQVNLRGEIVPREVGLDVLHSLRVDLREVERVDGGVLEDWRGQLGLRQDGAPRGDEVDELVLVDQVLLPRRDHRGGRRVRVVLILDVFILESVEARLLQLVRVGALDLVNLEKRHRRLRAEPRLDLIEIVVGVLLRVGSQVDVVRERRPQPGVPESHDPAHRLHAREFLRLVALVARAVRGLHGGEAGFVAEALVEASDVYAPARGVGHHGDAEQVVLRVRVAVVIADRGVVSIVPPSVPRGVVPGFVPREIRVLLKVILAIPVRPRRPLHHRAVIIPECQGVDLLFLGRVLRRGEGRGDLVDQRLVPRPGGFLLLGQFLVLRGVERETPREPRVVLGVRVEDVRVVDLDLSGGEVGLREVGEDLVVHVELDFPPGLSVMRGEQQALVRRLLRDVHPWTDGASHLEEDVFLDHDGPVPVGDVVDLPDDVPHLVLEPLVLFVVAVGAVEDLLGPDVLILLHRAEVPLGVVHQVDGRDGPFRVREVVVEVDLNLGDVHVRADDVAIRLAAEAAVLGKLKRRLAPPIPALRLHPRRRHHAVDPVQHLVLAAHRRGGRDERRGQRRRQRVRLLRFPLNEEDAEVKSDKHQKGEQRDVVRPSVVLSRGDAVGFVGQRGSERDGERGAKARGQGRARRKDFKVLSKGC